MKCFNVHDILVVMLYVMRSYVTKQPKTILRHHMDPNSEPKFDLYEPLLLLFPNNNSNNEIVSTAI